MQANTSLSYLASAFISRDLNDEMSLVKTIKEALQKIPTIEIVIIMIYHSNWFTFYLYLPFNINSIYRWKSHHIEDFVIPYESR